MTAGEIHEFRSISVRDEFGAVQDHSFTLFADPRDMLLSGGGLEFHICVIESRQIGGFVNQPASPEQMATVAAGKPAWLDVLMSVEITDPDAIPPLIDVNVLAPQEADAAVCAVASALLAVETGEVEFDSSPSDYLVRVEARGRMRVALYDDEQSQVWRGRTWVEDGDLM